MTDEEYSKLKKKIVQQRAMWLKDFCKTQYQKNICQACPLHILKPDHVECGVGTPKNWEPETIDDFCSMM